MADDVEMKGAAAAAAPKPKSVRPGMLDYDAVPSGLPPLNLHAHDLPQEDAFAAYDDADDAALVEAGGRLGSRKRVRRRRGMAQERLSWYQDPRLREHWKTVAAALFLLLSGLALMAVAIVVEVTDLDAPRSIVFFILSALCLLPGGYITVYIILALRGRRGYDFAHILALES